MQQTPGRVTQKPVIPVPGTPVVPPVPKAKIPKIPLPKPEETSKLDHIVEDEAEIADIEESLVDILVDDHELEIHEESIGIPESLAAGDDYSDGEEDERMEHLEDFEDIEGLDKRYSGFVPRF